MLEIWKTGCVLLACPSLVSCWKVRQWGKSCCFLPWAPRGSPASFHCSDTSVIILFSFHFLTLCSHFLLQCIPLIYIHFLLSSIIAGIIGNTNAGKPTQMMKMLSRAHSSPFLMVSCSLQMPGAGMLLLQPEGLEREIS